MILYMVTWWENGRPTGLKFYGSRSRANASYGWYKGYERATLKELHVSASDFTLLKDSAEDFNRLKEAGKL